MAWIAADVDDVIASFGNATATAVTRAGAANGGELIGAALQDINDAFTAAAQIGVAPEEYDEEYDPICDC